MEEKGFFTKDGGGKADRTPRDSATVILLRDCKDGAFEVFLMRRRSDQAFMGGAYVFPGGRMEEGDADPGLAGSTGGFSAADAQRLLQEAELPGAIALGLFIAAIRETFEEAGVLLARDAGGNLVDLSAPDSTARFSRYRLELNRRQLAFADLIAREGLLLAPGLLVPYAHWITPEIEPRRFDTRFLLARVPDSQVPVHDRMELTDSSWMTPATALAEHEAGLIALMPPTLKTMEELLRFSDTDTLFADSAAKRIRAILPQAFRTADSFGIRLPYDSEYTLAGGREFPNPGGSTRIVMEGGIWRARSA